MTLHPGQVALPAFLAARANLGAVRLAAPPRLGELAAPHALVDSEVRGQQESRNYAHKEDRDSDRYPNRDSAPERGHEGKA